MPPSRPPLGFEQIQFDPAQCRRDLDAFAELLEREELQEQADILPFFKDHPHLALFMGIFNPNLSKCDLLCSEYDLDGMCYADLVIGDSEHHSYCFVEFEPGTLNAVFDVAGRRMTEWSKRFEHGFGQIIDWLWLLHSGEGTPLFEARFGSPEINATALLVIGRDAGISDGDRRRYKWRRDRIIVDSRPVQFCTYDELLATLRRRFDFLSISPEK